MKLPSPGRAWEDCLEAGVGVADVVLMLEHAVLFHSCLMLCANEYCPCYKCGPEGQGFKVLERQTLYVLP